MKKLEDLNLYAWVGMDELGSGEIGIKQGYVPAGYIPLVGVDRAKIEALRPMLDQQARQYGKRIRLVRFSFAEILYETPSGSD